jgi:hypothetical protein
LGGGAYFGFMFIEGDPASNGPGSPGCPFGYFENGGLLDNIP